MLDFIQNDNSILIILWLLDKIAMYAMFRLATKKKKVLLTTTE